MLKENRSVQPFEFEAVEEFCIPGSPVDELTGNEVYEAFVEFSSFF
jgi:hypothetical protein